jgi:hypothetical protein
MFGCPRQADTERPSDVGEGEENLEKKLYRILVDVERGDKGIKTLYFQ